jgi:glycosyltransferase involved in cell wall biosynthesis
MTAPTISVVIPCYNYDRYVGQAIDSVVAQGYPALDLVVVNDGSTDDSLAVIQRHAAGATVVDQPNQGEVAARNAGFAASSGDVIIFLDADDLLEPTALRQVADAWSPSLAKIQFDLLVVDAGGNEVGRRFGHFGPDLTPQRVRDDFARTGTYRWPVTSGNAYSRWFVSRVFPQRFQGPVDGYLNTIAPLYGDVLTLPVALGRYRLHDMNQSSKTRSARGLAEVIAHRRRELDEMRRHTAMREWQLPETDPLDHELPFLNYRLIARKLGIDYPGADADSPRSLMRKALRLLSREGLPARITAVHGIWFVALTACPARWVPLLVELRFDRARLLRSLRERFGFVAEGAQHS